MNKILSLIGLAFRANKLKFGETVLEDIKHVKYMFIALDASEKTKERYLKKCNYYNIPYCLEYSCAELSNAVGKNNIKIIGVSDNGFKKLFLENK